MQGADHARSPTELLEAHKCVDLCMDIMHVAGMPFLMTILKNAMFRAAQPMASRTASAHQSAIDDVFCLHNDKEFEVSTIQCDNEFKPIMNPVKIILSKYLSIEHPGQQDTNE